MNNESPSRPHAFSALYIVIAMALDYMYTLYYVTSYIIIYTQRLCTSTSCKIAMGMDALPVWNGMLNCMVQLVTRNLYVVRTLATQQNNIMALHYSVVKNIVTMMYVVYIPM